MLRRLAVPAFVAAMAFPAVMLAQEHFDPKGKPPAEHTIAVMEKLRKSLNIADERDFEESKRGFIAAPDYQKFKADAAAGSPRPTLISTS